MATYSVVIPLYNKASHIRRAIDSVLGQTFDDFELLVVDDGSIDGGGEFVRQVDDPRVRLIVQENAGVSAARNRGAHEATTEVVAFLDADDVWDPDFLETIEALRCRFPDAAVWGTGYRIVTRDGAGEHPHYHAELPTNDDGGLIDYFSGRHPAGMHGDSPLLASTVAVQKGALIGAGAFPVGVVRGEDTDTWVRLALRHPIAWSPRVCVAIYEDAENRTDRYLYLGNYPLLESARAFEAEQAPEPLPNAVREYLAWRHTGLLRSKWLTGESGLLREISREFRHVPGYSWECWKWYLLSWIPHPLVKLAWKSKQLLARREPSFPQLRDIRSPRNWVRP